MFRSVLLAVVAVLALSAVAAASASAAEPEWQLNEKPVTKATATTLSSAAEAFKLEDWGTSGGAVEIKCSAAGEGEVAPEGKGAITKLTMTKCHLVKSGGCKKEEQKVEESHEWVKLLGLPLKSKLAEEPSYEDRLLNAGNLGFSYECTNILGTKSKDECRNHNEIQEWFQLEAYNEPLGVLLEFATLSSRSKNVRFKCSLSNGQSPRTGELFGAVLMKGPSGETLSIKP
jgi:hypothetical protein